MALTLPALKKLRPADRPYKKFHGKGLFVIVNTDGGVFWRFKYRFQGREKMLSLGQWPEVTLTEAENRRDDFRKQLRDGIDPSVKRQAERNADGDTFRAVAEEWLGQQKDLSPDTVEQFRKRLVAQDAVPTILELQQRLEGIRAAELEKCLRHVGPVSADQRAAIEMVSTQLVNKILHYPILQLKEASDEPQERESLRRTIRKIFGLR